MKLKLNMILKITLTSLTSLTSLAPNALANPVCERLRHELEHHCGAGLEFYSAHRNRDLMIMNTPYTPSHDSSSTRLVCTYNDAPGLVSIHTKGSICEEAANIAGNLCFRQGLSNLVNLRIDDLTTNRNCSEKISYSPLDPILAKGFLWGAGFMETKYVLNINNLDGYVERRPNPEYPGDDQPDSRIVKLNFTDPNFERFREIIEAIRIETMSQLHCELLNSMMSKPLQNLAVIMIDEMSPHIEFNTSEGAVITNSPCVEVRHFFPKFEEAISYISQF
jgi:hypothetical protein